MSSEQERLSNILDTEVESTVFKLNCKHGVQVESALLASIQSRVLSSNSQSQKPADDLSLVHWLSHNDPFSTTSTVPIHSKPTKLAELLKEHDPFVVVDAIADVCKTFSNDSSYSGPQRYYNTQQASSNSFNDFNNSQSPSSLLVCDEACQGCSYCEGIHYINSIRTQENMEDYEQAVEDGDVDAIVAADKCMEINEGIKEAGSTEYYQPCINSSDCNPSYLSLWEMREEGKTMKGAAAQRNQHFNS